MSQQVEGDLHATGPVRNQRGREPARVHIERGVPGMIYPRRARKPVFADDLRIELQRGAGLLPFGDRQAGPGLRDIVHGCLHIG